jgi:pyruvate dehydrogenase E2 component (dihydrolipoamide acetyltransferase)
MASPVIMPRQGQSVESCIIAQWHKKVGDKVSVGDQLFTYETDKAAFEETAKADGELLAIFFGEGDDVPCLTNVCVIGRQGEDVNAFAPAAASAATPAAPAPMPEAVAAPAAAVAQTADGARLAISPRARHLAEKQHADLRAVVATGPKGRVIERDVRALIDQGRIATGAAGTGYPAGAVGTGIGGRICVADTLGAEPAPASDEPADFTVEKHSTIRKLIAKSMSLSLGTIAQLTYNASFDATDIVDFRAKLKKVKEGGLADLFGLAEANITLNDIILYAVSRVVKRHRACNASFQDDRIIFYTHVHLGMAVDTPRGLMVPTIFHADRLSLAEISAQAKTLAAECQKGTISPDKLKVGTFTVSNLGGFGIESFTPVINPPQTAILGVNCVQTAVRDVNGEAVPYPSMSLSLTCDHRAVDGAPAARFLKDLKTVLESFSLLLMK